MSKPEQLITEHIDIWTSAILAKSTAGRGSSKKYELYGIKKLRELILELAVRGKLVPQDANDEPASVLLEKIATQKARLVKEGKIKKTKQDSEISTNKELFKLPNGWEWTALRSISTYIQRGKGPSYAETGKVRVVSQKCIQWKGFDVTASRYISDASLEKYKEERYLRNSDLLWNSTGTGTAGRINKLSNIEDNTLVADSHVTVIRTIQVNSAFIELFISSPSVQRRIDPDYTKSLVSGSTKQVELNTSVVVSLMVPLPPFLEQHRIVDKVGELMLLCDQLEQQTEASIDAHATLVDVLLATLTDSADANELAQNWARVSEYFDSLLTTEQNIEALKQTVLQLAVMGKLVPQNPEDEPASVLLEKIEEEKEQLIKNKKIKRTKPLPLISDDEKPFDLPRGWEWCRLPEVGELARGKSKHRPRNAPELFSGGTIPLVQTGDVARAENVITTYTSLYNKNGLEQSRLWPTGTLCITIAANIADTAKLGFDACFPDSVVGFLPYEKKMDISYFDYFLRTAKNHLEDFAPSTAQKNINLEILGSLLVPLPPLNELNEITKKVKVLFSLCDQLKETLQHSQITQVQLTDALIDKALI